ncbi:MAG: peptidylprolyl isomerase [Micavibrio sp.]
MKTLAPGIEVNGIKISIEEINAEVQYHPAESLYSAKYEAMKALVIKEMLIQRAVDSGLCNREEAVKNPDGVIDDLLEREISIPAADEETCKRYYENNKKKFFTSPLFEVSHILYMAPPDDEKARAEAQTRAQAALSRIRQSPGLFEIIAKDESACSSAKDGGMLGQISRGQTMPAFETALFQMQEGETSREPVPSEVGYHIIRVHKRVEGKQLPFENVMDWIAQDLHEKSWNRAFNQYIQLLAGRSHISGFRLEAAQNPLVQ